MIDFSNVTKAFSTQVVLNNVSFRINRGERVGIVGPNGAGKSTLFNLINGDVLPDKGDVMIPSTLRISCLHQHVMDSSNDEINLLDFVADAIPRLSEIRHRINEIESDAQLCQTSNAINEIGELHHEWEVLGGYRMETEAKKALAGLGFRTGSETHKMKSFSGGWQMRAALARTLIADPDILLLDEPSNYLDVPAIEWLDKYLCSFHGTLLLISHDRYLLKTLVEMILEVNAGQCVRYNGNYNYYVKEREQRAIVAENERKNYEKQREHMLEFINRFRSKASKAALVQSMIKQLEKLDAEQQLAPEVMKYSGELRLPPPPASGSLSIALENAGFGYQKGKFIFRHLSLEIPKGEKVAVVGYNGMGKTTLLRTMSGVVQLLEGNRILGHNVIVGYQSQEFSDILDGEKGVYDIVRGVLSDTAETKQLRALLGAFGFSGNSQDKQVKVLSGGEKIRLCFARIFANPPNLLLLDEPTTHLDIQARETLQKSIQKYTGTCVFVSHDIEFLRQCATHIIEVSEAGIKRYFGHYDYYLNRKKEEASFVPELEKKADLKPVETVQVVNQKELRKIRAQQREKENKGKGKIEREITQCENAIVTAEKEMSEIVERVSSGDPTIDFSKENRRQKEIAYEISDLTAKWEQLTDALLAFD